MREHLYDAVDLPQFQQIAELESTEEAMKCEAIAAIARGKRFPLRPGDVDLLLWIVRGFYDGV